MLPAPPGHYDGILTSAAARTRVADSEDADGFVPPSDGAVLHPVIELNGVEVVSRFVYDSPTDVDLCSTDGYLFVRNGYTGGRDLCLWRDF